MPRSSAAPLVLALLLLVAWPAAGQEGGAGSPAPLSLDHLLHEVTRAVEVVGIAVIVLGAIAASVHLVWQVVRHEPPLAAAYHGYRANLARAILLGLEFLVAADIINTVAFEPTLRGLAILAGIVLIRTFLSFSLEVEIEGRWPWQHGAAIDKAEARRLLKD
jgi:uncharacterized membrane protein